MGPLVGLLFILSLSSSLVSVFSQDHHACDCDVFCYGDLLHVIQNASIFDDQKTYTDLNLMFDKATVLEAFENLPDYSEETLRNFTSDYFSGPGNDIEQIEPSDWNCCPSFLDDIEDGALREWAEELVAMWKNLTRKVNDDVKESNNYTTIYSENSFVVPGGRFNEFYYWDSYWTLKGLLISEMFQTSQGMILNYVDMVASYGFVPNGGRIYYSSRTQPPMLTPMVKLYYDYTEDQDFVERVLPYCEVEYQFWMRERVVLLQMNDHQHVLNRYHAELTDPRPESYMHDYTLADGLNETEKVTLFSNLATASESGWDFSSRWFNGDTFEDADDALRSTNIMNIVPVDLNSILCVVEDNLATFHSKLGSSFKASLYRGAVKQRKEAIQEILWNEDDGMWYDFDLDTLSQRNEYFLSNISPMWAQCHTVDSGDNDEVEEKVVTYMEEKGLFKYPGGIPVSLTESGQQWDFPNAWPPLQYMAIEALDSCNSDEYKDLALEQAQKWTRSNYLGYKNHGMMYEKYDVTRVGTGGTGGEYELQAGFGWTNGVALHFLNKYSDSVYYSRAQQNNAQVNTISPVLTLVSLIYSFIRIMS